MIGRSGLSHYNPLFRANVKLIQDDSDNSNAKILNAFDQLPDYWDSQPLIRCWVGFGGGAKSCILSILSLLPPRILELCLHGPR